MPARLLRARIAVWLDRLSHRIAPELSYAERERLVSRISRDAEAFRHQGPLRVRRPGGLTTTHELRGRLPWR